MGHHKNRVIFITGASTGIGRATAIRLATEGATLFLVDIAKDELESTVQKCRSFGSETTSAECDVANESQVTRAISSTVAQYDRIDAVINVAGIQLWSHSHEHSLADFEKTLSVNLTGTFMVCREAIPHLLKNSGSIVNVSSTTALAGIPYSVAYAASKAGVLALTKSLAVEYGEKGLQVNCVNPGGIKTEMSKMPSIENPDLNLLLRQSPLGKFSEPESVAGLISYLVSEEAQHINGESIRIDGGALA
ncbi:MAG: short-chain dehydrogenase [Acidimicrobiaceae bacterium]|jgi:meso-butanediol dehydrogenase/(S,S)-butanediol dehydrogenase/diacetyl reductase|nr:short-chain dehydrogenase [Acidimicrobiaceae bacterium]|tara:strand:- start:75739 stop:76485 length:747 start_codon:yes stop_codon:yes gene_type:complete